MLRIKSSGSFRCQGNWQEMSFGSSFTTPSQSLYSTASGNSCVTHWARQRGEKTWCRSLQTSRLVYGELVSFVTVISIMPAYPTLREDCRQHELGFGSSARKSACLQRRPRAKSSGPPCSLLQSQTVFFLFNDFSSQSVDKNEGTFNENILAVLRRTS